MKKIKHYCERCGEEIKTDISDHLHGYSYAMTYIPTKTRGLINSDQMFKDINRDQLFKKPNSKPLK